MIIVYLGGMDSYFVRAPCQIDWYLVLLRTYLIGSDNMMEIMKIMLGQNYAAAIISIAMSAHGYDKGFPDDKKHAYFIRDIH